MKTNKTIAQMKKERSVSYIGGNDSAKLQASFRHGTLTYAIYFAPADSSGYDVCPCSKHCRANCLNTSGNSKVWEIAKAKGTASRNAIQDARVNRTKWFFEDREGFMKAMLAEMKAYKRKADENRWKFSVRLNATSDISPEDFQISGVNVLEAFPDVQFYDYTKVPSRLSLPGKYPNYDLTFSYDGHNWAACKRALAMGVRVAVVFHGKTLPQTFEGIPVVDGNEYDMRYEDLGAVIVGLHYHPVASDYASGKYEKPDTPFVVDPETDPRCNVKPKQKQTI